jgi:small subunit ribosomal protein S16
MVGILEPQFRVGEVLGKVVKADSAAKSLIKEGTTTTTTMTTPAPVAQEEVKA